MYNAQKGAASDKDSDGNTVALSKSKNKKSAVDAAAPLLSTKRKELPYEAFGVSEKVW